MSNGLQIGTFQRNVSQSMHLIVSSPFSLPRVSKAGTSHARSCRRCSSARGSRQPSITVRAEVSYDGGERNVAFAIGLTCLVKGIRLLSMHLPDGAQRAAFCNTHVGMRVSVRSKWSDFTFWARAGKGRGPGLKEAERQSAAVRDRSNRL